ncbi:UDP-glycosyltransferase 74E2-like isoform X1 [Impatiens glandulifera]|uniref:UDP-glycosyltransferase 74E2-like isoform X1 n=1 Tax=Impatiens glandulifera TaxID=253017 RepID=UPI001FB05570|nr:UDP-glycosyltransferase 74E2-like isoform X1 [Impatiens glandulifera]
MGELGAHVLAIPFPTQGHINPILQFSKRLSSKGVKVTIIATTFMSKSLPQLQKAAADASIQVDCISDGYNPGDNFPTVDECLARFNDVVPQTLTQLIVDKHLNSDHPPTVLIYDSVFSWAIDIAKNLGLLSATFYTQSCSVSAIYYHFTQANLNIPSTHESSFSLDLPPLPALPPLKVTDLPSFIVESTESNPNLFQLVSSQFYSFGKADWIFFNSFDKLEEEVLKWVETKWAVKTIGPTVPSMYLDKKMEDDREYGICLFPPSTESCMNWLDSREKSGSVVYVAFGSLASLGEDQMEEIAQGLKNTNAPFLWVVRASEEGKLPSWFKEETSEKGLVVNWCPQLDVLAHRAVGCFVTHCGWNSTLEALSLGVPMVTIPQWSDQMTNSKYVMDVWKVGVRVKVNNENGFFTRDEIEVCIKKVMEEGDGGNGYRLRQNALKWKKLAIESVDQGGSSDTNIQEFVSTISLLKKM